MARVPAIRVERLPSSIRDELRAAAAMKCHEIISRKGTLKLHQIHDYMFKFFHGDASSNAPSTLDQLVTGQDQFQNLFVHSTSIITDKDANQVSADELTLKEQNSRRPEKNFLVDKQITLSILQNWTFKSTTVITGRTLHDLVLASKENIRKAHAFLETKVEDIGEPIQSGTTRDDVIEALLDHMFIELKKKGDGADANSTIELEGDPPQHQEGDNSLSENADDTTLDIRPADYIFRGFYCVLLFGTLAPLNERLVCLSANKSELSAEQDLSRAKMRADRKRADRSWHVSSISTI
jgi:hypothetical protein